MHESIPIIAEFVSAICRTGELGPEPLRRERVVEDKAEILQNLRSGRVDEKAIVFNNLVLMGSRRAKILGPTTVIEGDVVPNAVDALPAKSRA